LLNCSNECNFFLQSDRKLQIAAKNDKFRLTLAKPTADTLVACDFKIEKVTDSDKKAENKIEELK
jgi:hypothetical protein